MKKLLLILISVTLFGCSEKRVLLHELINKGTTEDPLMYYENKLFNGISFDVYNSGELKEEGSYVDGKPDGLWILYHPNGEKKMRVSLANGKQEGLRTDWYSDGSKELEVNFINGKQEGICKFWYSNGQLELEALFENGKFNGDYTRWYDNGSIKYIYNHQEKTYKEYWDNGKIYVDAHSIQNPSSPLVWNNQVIEVHADFYDKKGELINKIPHSRLKEPYQMGESNLGGGPCHGKFNCVNYNYYLNGEVLFMDYVTYGNVHIHKTFYENGRLSMLKQGDEVTSYKRNGKKHSFGNDKKQIFLKYTDDQKAYDQFDGKPPLFNIRKDLFD